MTNQQLLDFIKQQIGQGVPREQITRSLITTGWRLTDINESFSQIDSAKPVRQQSSINWGSIVASIIALAIVGVIVFYSDDVTKIASDLFSTRPTVTTTTDETNTNPYTSTLDGQDKAFALALRDCDRYEGTFVHPLSGEVLNRSISGETNGDCEYEEEMPKGGLLICNYSPEMRAAISQFYLDIIAGVTNTYMIDGESVQSPLEVAANDGSCEITGY